MTNFVREQAALILAIAASNPEANNTWDAQIALYGFPSTWTLTQREAGEMARLALSLVPQRFHGNDAYAHAEAMLRSRKT